MYTIFEFSMISIACNTSDSTWYLATTIGWLPIGYDAVAKVMGFHSWEPVVHTSDDLSAYDRLSE